MATFHDPRVSEIALQEAQALFVNQSITTTRTKGQIFGLPIYEAVPASTLAQTAAVARRVGWRYLFVAEQDAVGSDAVVDFERSLGGRPVLRSYASSRLPQRLIDVLKQFETEESDNDHSYYIVLLAIPALHFELVWFKDAAMKHPNDLFRALTPTRYFDELDKEISARHCAFPISSGEHQPLPNAT